MDRPLVSVGVATFNGARFIGQALESLSRQDYPNLEIVVSDNASTDATAEIVRAYAARDPRIRYSRNARNLGSIGNFDRAFELARGEHFMWAGDHDLWEPDTVSALSAVLRGDPRCVLSYGRTQVVDGEGRPLFVTPERIDTRGLSAARSYGRLVWKLGWCNMIYGMIRASTLRTLLPFSRVWGPDNLLLARLSLAGSIAQVDRVLFYRRETRAPETFEEFRLRALKAFDPATAADRAAMSHFQLLGELRDAHLEAVRAAGLAPAGRAVALAATLGNFWLQQAASLLRPWLRKLTAARRP